MEMIREINKNKRKKINKDKKKVNTNNKNKRLIKKKIIHPLKLILLYHNPSSISYPFINFFFTFYSNKRIVRL